MPKQQLVKNGNNSTSVSCSLHSGHNQPHMASSPVTYGLLTPPHIYIYMRILNCIQQDTDHAHHPPEWR